MSATALQARGQLIAAIGRLHSVMLINERGWRDLEVAISRYSEEQWSAGWLHDVEFTVWEGIVDGDPGNRVHAGELYQMATLALSIGGWVYWDDDGPSHPSLPNDGLRYNRVRFVAFDEWLPLYETWRAKQEARR